MTTLVNGFEGGTSGTTLTTGNSGYSGANAFDIVSVGTGATLAYDNTYSAHGNLSCKVATGSTSASSDAEWSTSMGTQTQVWFRLYLYFTANPAASFRVFQVGTNGAFVRINAAGTVSVVPNAGTTTTTTATIPLNQWFRIEGYVLAGAGTGQNELKLFGTADSTTPTETDTSPATQTFNTSFTTYFFGVDTNTANVAAYWQDDIGLSSTGYIGPTQDTVSGSAALGAMALSVTATETFPASGSAAGAPLKFSGTGGETFGGTGSPALAPMRMSGSAGEAIGSSGSAALGPLAVTAAGGNYFVNCAGSLTLAPLTTFGRYIPPQGVTGWDLYSTLQQQAAYAEYYKTTLPMACPHDGEPLREGPPSMSGVLFCPYDGFQYPRDWDAETMSGM